MNNAASNTPQHVAIIMDGNGRWAKKRLLPRAAGHRAGAKAVRKAIDFCLNHHIPTLSLFALSVENFQSRPIEEVQLLIALFSESLLKNLNEMHENGIRIRIIGDTTVFDPSIQDQIQQAENLTRHNQKLTLVVAVNYSGRWDITQAAERFAQCKGEATFASFLSLSDLPEPDLLIRTSGEQRISNFMLWQFAYTELFFTDTLWPDFDKIIFLEAINAFQKRTRRFGLTSEQIGLQKIAS